MTSEAFATQIDRSRLTQNGWWTGLCPAHSDKDPSLRWKAGDVKIKTIKCMSARCL